VERVSAVLCERVRAFASLELDGELSELEQSILEAHIEDCRACAEFRASIGAFTVSLRAAPPEAVTRTFRLPRRPRRASRLVPTAAAAAAIVVAGLAGMLVPLGGDNSRGFEIGNEPRTVPSGVSEQLLPTISPTDEIELRPGARMRAL
jgi:predicted anti-sigma-YlaC factor YlaD